MLEIAAGTRNFEHYPSVLKLTAIELSLRETQHHALMEHPEERTGPTLAHVSERGRQQASAVTAQLPDQVFAQRAAGWDTTVRWHLLAATEAIPDDTHLAHLRQFIGKALAEIERL